MAGKQRSANGPASLDTGGRNTDKRVLGLDFSGDLGNNIYWYIQYLWNSWDGFLDTHPSRDYHWHGGFAGIDYIPHDHWAFSVLSNYADANDLAGVDITYEGIDINSLSLTTRHSRTVPPWR